MRIKNKLDYRIYPSNNKNNELAYPKIIVTIDKLPNSSQVEKVDDFVEGI